MTTIDVLDKRLTDPESIVWDLPGLLTTRTAKYEAEFASIRAEIISVSNRLDKIERNQGMLQVDMRDLRNGVARFMVEFDQRMRALEAAVEKDRADNAARFDKIDATLAEILRRLPKA